MIVISHAKLQINAWIFVSGGWKWKSGTRWYPPFPCCPVSHQCPWKKTLIEKKTNLYAQINSLKKKCACILLSSAIYTLTECNLPVSPMDKFWIVKVRSILHPWRWHYLRNYLIRQYQETRKYPKSTTGNVKDILYQNTILRHWHYRIIDIESQNVPSLEKNIEAALAQYWRNP